MGGIVISFSVNFSDGFFNLLNSVTAREKTLVWFASETTSGRPNMNGLIVNVLVLLTSVYMANAANKMVRNAAFNSVNIVRINTEERLSSTIYNVFVYMLLLLPFLAINSTFSRMVDAMLPMVFISCANAIRITNQRKRYNEARIFSLVVVLWVVFLYVQLDLGFLRGKDLPLLNLLKNNLIFGLS